MPGIQTTESAYSLHTSLDINVPCWGPCALSWRGHPIALFLLVVFWGLNPKPHTCSAPEPHVSLSSTSLLLFILRHGLAKLRRLAGGLLWSMKALNMGSSQLSFPSDPDHSGSSLLFPPPPWSLVVICLPLLVSLSLKLAFTWVTASTVWTV